MAGGGCVAGGLVAGGCVAGGVVTGGCVAGGMDRLGAVGMGGTVGAGTAIAGAAAGPATAWPAIGAPVGAAVPAAVPVRPVAAGGTRRDARLCEIGGRSNARDRRSFDERDGRRDSATDSDVGLGRTLGWGNNRRLGRDDADCSNADHRADRPQFTSTIGIKPQAHTRHTKPRSHEATLRDALCVFRHQLPFDDFGLPLGDGRERTLGHADVPSRRPTRKPEE